MIASTLVMLFAGAASALQLHALPAQSAARCAARAPAVVLADDKVRAERTLTQSAATRSPEKMGRD